MCDRPRLHQMRAGLRTEGVLPGLHHQVSQVEIHHLFDDQASFDLVERAEAEHRDFAGRADTPERLVEETYQMPH